MEHVNGWCFRDIYMGGLWENDLYVSVQYEYLHQYHLRRKTIDLLKHTFPE